MLEYEKKPYITSSRFAQNIIFFQRSSIHKMGRGIFIAGHVFSQMRRKRMQKEGITWRFYQTSLTVEKYIILG